MPANLNAPAKADGSSSSISSTHLQSPNAIPPRTSSAGGYIASASFAKSALRPVSEADWLAQSIRTPRSPPSSAFLTQNHSSTMASNNPDPARYATEDFDYTARKTWSVEKEKILVGPYEYLLALPGKDIRTRLINAFNVWLNVPKETLETIANVVAMLHTASLLIDDVEDSSLLRRGQPVAHNIFGTAVTINSGNYVYFRALQELRKLNNPAAVTIFSDELINLHRGQGMDLYWRDSLTCPTEDEYLEMVGNKTGGLFRLAIKLMQAESKVTIDCVPLVNILGIIFQIQDDYRNLFSPEYGQNKGFCEDLTEGKFSFCIIHSIRANPVNRQLINILKQRTKEDMVKRYAVSYMESTGSFAYTRSVLEILIQRARKIADELDGAEKSVGIHRILDKLAV
ncbi:terpenoid synthase [Xylaria sp. CBS 124048]|nr:terpenoid synthase [Xylaria sp. CBS 124048]